MKHLANTDDKMHLLTRLAQLKADDQAAWGQMNANQMLCHLSDSFKSMMGEKDIAMPNSPGWQRGLTKWVALYWPIPWPKNLNTMPENDQLIGGTAVTNFETDRAELIQLIARFSAPEKDFSYQQHPSMGRLSEREWQRWAYLHLDHHLRQFRC